MTTARYCELTQTEPSDECLLACFYLEAKGLIFGVDFEIENAIAKAEGLYCWEVA